MLFIGNLLLVLIKYRASLSLDWTGAEVRGTVSYPAVLSAPVVHPREVRGLLGGHTPCRHPLSALQALHPPEEGGEGSPHTCQGLHHLARQRQYCFLQLGCFGLKTAVKGGREGEVLCSDYLETRAVTLLTWGWVRSGQSWPGSSPTILAGQSAEQCSHCGSPGSSLTC